MKKIVALTAVLLVLLFSMGPGIADTHGQNETEIVNEVTGETTSDEPYSPPSYSPTANKKPVADAGLNQTVYVDQIVEFSGADSTDPDGYLTSWTWSFGDGAEASGVNVSHIYSEPGNYTVTLTVVDVRGGEDTDTCTITVRETPPLPPPPPLPPILDNLTITPAELELGDNVTISFDIMNTDSQSISYMVNIQIGELTFPVDVELEAYESKTMSRTIFPGAVGEYNVTVHGMTGSFTVEPEAEPEPKPEPAEFVVSDLSITLEETEEGDTVTVSVDVTNIGEETGDYTVELVLDGFVVRSEEITPLEGGLTTTVSFDVMRNEGTYQVEIDGLTGSFTVKAPPKPAELEFSNLRIFYPGVIPPEVEKGQTMTVTVSIEVENVGELEGGRTVEFKVDGEVVDSKGVALEGGASATVLFELTRGEGTYQVEVEGMTDSFTVTTPSISQDYSAFIRAFMTVSIISPFVLGFLLLWRRRLEKLK